MNHPSFYGWMVFVLNQMCLILSLLLFYLLFIVLSSTFMNHCLGASLLFIIELGFIFKRNMIGFHFWDERYIWHLCTAMLSQCYYIYVYIYIHIHMYCQTTYYAKTKVVFHSMTFLRGCVSLWVYVSILCAW
jgi:hypothetical protein